MLRIPRATAQVKAPKYRHIEQINYLVLAQTTQETEILSIRQHMSLIMCRADPCQHLISIFIHGGNSHRNLSLISDIHASVHP